MPGFGLKVGKTSKSFVTQKDINGKPCFNTIGRYGHFTVEEAKTLGKEQLYWMSLGVDPKKRSMEERRNFITLTESFESYKNTRKNLSPVTIKGYKYALQKYIADWAKRPIIDITKEDVIARHAMLGQCHGERTANGTMRIVRLLVNHANAVYELDIKNPVEHLMLLNVQETIRELKNIRNRLNEFTHVKEETFSLSKEDQDIEIQSIINAMHEFFSLNNDLKTALEEQVEESITDEMMEHVFSEYLPELAELAHGTPIEGIDVEKIKLEGITPYNIRFSVSGTLDVTLEWGRREDFTSCDQNFPFSSFVDISFYDSDLSKTECVDMQVDTSSWYEDVIE